MRPPPREFGDARVLRWTPIDERHRPTGGCRHIVGGELAAPFAALAIAAYPRDGGYYLFYCDAEWNVVNDSYHDSIEGVIAQAEFEYAGSSATWREA